MNVNVRVIRITFSTWSVQLEGASRVSHYGSQREADQTAVCVGLEAISRRVAKGEQAEAALAAVLAPASVALAPRDPSAHEAWYTPA